MLAIAGGSGTTVDWTVLMPNGVECKDHGLPNLPDTLVLFAIAQAYDNLILLCGGSKGNYPTPRKLLFRIDKHLGRNIDNEAITKTNYRP